VSLSAVLAAAAFTVDTAKATVSRELLATTVQAAALIAAGKPLMMGAVSAGVATLLKGAKTTMLLAKLKAGATIVLFLTLASVGIGLSSNPQATTVTAETPAPSSMPKQPRDGSPESVRATANHAGMSRKQLTRADQRLQDRLASVAPAAGEDPPGKTIDVAPSRGGPAVQMPGPGGAPPTAVVASPSGPVAALPTVHGRIVGPNGKPPAAATIMVRYSDHSINGLGTNDGKFQIPAGRLDLVGGKAQVAPLKPVGVAVAAEGLGFGWVDAAALTAKSEPTVQLVDDLPIRGRILDQDGRPVAGAKVRVEEVRDYSGKDLKAILRALTAKEGESAAVSTWVVPPEWDSVVPGGYAAGRATTTGIHGRFELTGLGRGRAVRLQITAKSGKPLGLTILTIAPTQGDPPLPEKDEAGRPVYRMQFEHRLAADNE
jgi:hypothetical protein